MKTPVIICACVLALGGALQAGTTYNLDFNTQSNSPGLVFDGNEPIGPYAGSLNGVNVQLYCDDFPDNINYGQQNVTVYSTALPTTTNTAFRNDTRYGVANPSTAGAGYPAGTQLYDEIAWLATQMQNTSGANAGYNNIAIQEAIWTLTDDKNVAQSPQNQKTTGSGTLGDGGIEQSYTAWIADAAADYNQTGLTGYASVISGDWSIITAVGSAGCTLGSETNGCSGAGGTGAGTAGTGAVTQEFLAYSYAPVQNTGNALGSVPEPASFIMIGSGLLLGALVGRRINTKSAR
jgi:hypothetical protein